MQKTLIIGMGAFGFAVAHYLSHLHPEREFLAYEKNEAIAQSLRRTREHAYFFLGVYLPDNVVILSDIEEVLSSVDIIIIVIPVPFIRGFISGIASHVRPGTLFVNCSKGIDNTTHQTVSDTIRDALQGTEYTYAVLSGGMIASELVAAAPLGATLGVSDIRDADILRDLFQSPTLAIDITPSYRDVELLGSLKNIFALYAGYLEGQGHQLSSIGHALVDLYRELPVLLPLLGGSGEVDFGSYALGGDLIATCFGESRNRYLGRLVGTGISPAQAVSILQSEKKHAEGYETLKGLLPLIEENTLPTFGKIGKIFYP